MAPIFRYFCTNCGYELPGGMLQMSYALTNDGEKTYLSEAMDDYEVSKITGMNYWDAFHEGLIGSDVHCLCFDCLATFDMDLDKEIKKCPKCESLNVKSSRGSVGSKCPKCKRGTIKSEMTAIT